jgi:cobalt-zinc-cadmium resistance protein CzcA
LSLGAIDFGIIVDASIVMTEAILRRREARPDSTLNESDAANAELQVARPIFFATLIIITTYLPLFAFDRIEAKLFYPMVYAVGFAQLGALLLALFLVPGLAYLAYRKPQRVFHNYVLIWIEARYRQTLGRLLRRPLLLSDGRECRRYGGGACEHGLARILARTRRRRTLSSRGDGRRNFASEGEEMDAELRKAVSEFPEVAPSSAILAAMMMVQTQYPSHLKRSSCYAPTTPGRRECQSRI